MITFNNWLKMKESSAFTRTRNAAATVPPTGPSIPDAAINSRSTTTPAVSKAIKKRNKKHCKPKKKM